MENQEQEAEFKFDQIEIIGIILPIILAVMTIVIIAVNEPKDETKIEERQEMPASEQIVKSS